MRNIDNNEFRLQPEDAGDPEIFKRILHDDIGSRPVWGPVLNKMETLKLVPPLVLNKDTWISYSSDRMIRLGVMPTPEDIRKKVIFEGESFDYHDDISYKFGHELSHRLAPMLGRIGGNEGFMNLFDVFVAMRRRNESGTGLTALGSMNFYKGQGGVIQATEDLVELLNMYMWDQNYFDRYLKFLASEELADMRVKADVKLATIRPEVASALTKYLRESIALI